MHYPGRQGGLGCHEPFFYSSGYTPNRRSLVWGRCVVHVQHSRNRPTACPLSSRSRLAARRGDGVSFVGLSGGDCGGLSCPCPCSGCLPVRRNLRTKKWWSLVEVLLNLAFSGLVCSHGGPPGMTDMRPTAPHLRGRRPSSTRRKHPASPPLQRLLRRQRRLAQLGRRDQAWRRRRQYFFQLGNAYGAKSLQH